MRNDGRAAELAFVERVLTRGGAVERLYDAADLRGLNGGRAVADFKKPSDYIATIDGQTHFAEVKSCAGSVSFPFAQLETGQRSAALRHTRAGGDWRAYVFSYGLGQWFVMTGAQYLTAIETGKASLRFSVMSPWK